MNLSGPRQKFCEGVVSGLNGLDAYRAAYPKASASNARKNAPRLAGNRAIQAEVTRLRALADEKGGSAVLTLMEKRIFLARVVRALVATEPKESDLWHSIKKTENGTEYRLPDKLAAIKIDCDLAGEGSEADGNDALAALLERVMR